MIKIIRWLLLPISLIYAVIIRLRNVLYDNQIFKSQSFSIPTIVIGNLAIGGAGKSPMTEYLIRILKEKYKVATLSRGYGRKTKGFKFVESTSTALDVGDEPLQFKRKFNDVIVAVCEDRCTGIQKLESYADVIILDDAFQHRKLQAGINLLLFDFNSLFYPIMPLPTGNFRDNFSSTKRADYIVISKCPLDISENNKKHIEKIIRKYSIAPIFYSTIKYSYPQRFQNPTEKIDNLKGFNIILFCGIANPSPLIEYLQQENIVNIIQFPDHHNYSNNDYEKIINTYESLSANQKIIITTEKDVQRITTSAFSNYPLYYIPIEINIKANNGSTLNNYIESYVDMAKNIIKK